MSNGTEPLPLFGFDPKIVPDIDFCQKDASVIESEIITNYQNYYYLITQVQKTLARGDPVRLFLLSIIYQLVVQRSIVDSTGKQNLIKYSVGGNLDNIGARWGQRCLRLPATQAQTVIRFSLPAALTTNSAIPLGTLVQTGEQHQFATTKEDLIPAGSLIVDIPAQAVQSGESNNGFVPGQINQLVSWNAPFLVSASNVTTSSGGASTESDDHLRARIWMAPESFSTAGPYGAYEYWAASANPDIIDVSVWSDAAHAGEVYIYVLMAGPRSPTQAECDQVYAVCNDEKIRPLTDHVFVQPAIPVNLLIDADYYIKSVDAGFADTLESQCNTAYSNFCSWQTGKIGRDINPSKFDQMMVDAGAKRTVIRTPAFTVLNPQQVAVLDPNSKLNYMGLEDE